ncbi:hypothetical protein SDC9_206305 [bioreactor metagenome]|uniref:Uncharacterized protein n=1 Tax=bioreactor metagenome TaxID=1076179 RepID=A0A645J4N4_9ZZZZ
MQIKSAKEMDAQNAKKTPFQGVCAFKTNIDDVSINTIVLFTQLGISGIITKKEVIFDGTTRAVPYCAFNGRITN